MRKLVGVFASWLFVAAAAAQSPAPPDPVPPALRDWRGWVLKDFEYRACPLIASHDAQEADDYLCAWPGRIAIDANAGGATIAQTWRVDAPSWVPLPGDTDDWPQDVTANGQPAAVLLHDERPMLRLAPGTYQLKARIPWAQRPQQLTLPEEIGLVDLRVDGKAVTPIQRDGNELTLGRGEAAAPEADGLDLRVFRRLEDALPARLVTRIEISVSGQAREESFAPVLPAGLVPMSLTGNLPARIDNEGRLHVQVQPGTWQLELDARATEPLTTLAARLAPEPWPAQEIWSFQAVPGLRITNASGDTPIDPAQAGVPEDWRALPAFALADGGALTIEERSRGLSTDDANRLRLVREAWLDFAGAGFNAKDQVIGTMRRGWRLDVAAPFTLERAEADGEGLLVTKGANGETGVELRNPTVNLSAGVRIAQSGGELPIAGWRQTFDSVDLTLHLPYSWRLVAAPGADRADGSWIAHWNLLDVFLVAVIGLLAMRAFGWLGGALAGLYLVLGYHEGGAPLWTLLVALALLLLLRALPAGRLAEAARWLARAACVLLVLWTLPFLAAQVRYVLYPQLESSAYYGGNEMNVDGFGYEAVPASAPAPAAPPPPPRVMMQAPAPKPIVQEEALAGGEGKVMRRVAKAEPLQDQASSPSSNSMSNYAKSANKQRYAQNTVIQAGRGEPGWRFGTQTHLAWSGPVLAEQQVRLMLAPPWLVRTLRIVMLALLAWLVAGVARRAFAGLRAPRVPAQGAAAALAFLLCGAAGTGHAQSPGKDLLDELRSRLTEAPACAPECANVARAQVRADGGAVHVALDVNAGERVAVPLPGEDAALDIAAVRVDGAVQDVLARHDGVLWVPLSRGVHRVDLELRVGDSDHLALKFPLKPAYVELALAGWQAGGVNENRLLGDTLSLARERREADAPARAGAAQQFPPYVLVERRLVFDLEWRVESSAWRLAPQSGGFSIAVPLLPGEQVLSAGAKQQDGKVLLSFGADQSQIAWSSRLEQAPSVTLVAPPLGDRTEVWKVQQNPSWHAQFAGVPETQPSDGGEQWTHEFHPLPGETLAISLARPDAVAGRSVAIDSVEATTKIGSRSSDVTLTFKLRGTQGGEHAIALPEGAEVVGVQKNGVEINVRPRDGRLSLPVTPGEQLFAISLRQAQPVGFVARTPAFTLSAPAANVSTTLQLPDSRWVLFTFGPPVGPAVLYWGELVVMIVVAWALWRTRRTPLALWQWLLLGFGFSTGSWLALVAVAAWLFALDWRARWQGGESWLGFNAVQAVLAGATGLMLIAVLYGVLHGLLRDPLMSVTGHGSSPHWLRWFSDQLADGALPQAGAVSLPMWVYRIAMLAWALWLATALIAWLRWAFNAWSAGGYWRSRPKTARERIDPLPPAPQYRPAE